MAILTMGGYGLTMGGSALATSSPPNNFTARLKSLLDSDFAMAAVITDDHGTELYNSNGYTTGKITDLKMYGVPPFVVSFSASSGPYKLMKLPEMSAVYGDVIGLSRAWTTLDPHVSGGVWSASITAGTGELNFNVQTGYKAINWTGRTTSTDSSFYSSWYITGAPSDKRYYWALSNPIHATIGVMAIVTGYTGTGSPVSASIPYGRGLIGDNLSGVLTDEYGRVNPFVTFPVPVRDRMSVSGSITLRARTDQYHVAKFGFHTENPMNHATSTTSGTSGISMPSSSPIVYATASGTSYRGQSIISHPDSTSYHHSGLGVYMYCGKTATALYASSYVSDMSTTGFVTGVHLPIK